MKEICVLSGKGGTGKTSLSAAFATLGEQVAIADCDVDAANLYLVLQPENEQEEQFITGYKAVIHDDDCTTCGLCIDNCRFGAISFSGIKVMISETSCDGCKLCFRICPAGAIEMIPDDKSRWYAGRFRNGVMVHARLAPGEENSGKLVHVVREKVREMAQKEGLETVIIDGPPGTGCPVISSVTGTDKVIVVTEPTRSGFHDLKRIVELVTNFRIQLSVVINKYDLNEEISNQIAKWCEGMKIAVAGQIPFDRLVVDAMLHCKSIVEWAPGSSVSSEITKIWKVIHS
jgi:MinD superfamily P-loop ATPase